MVLPLEILVDPNMTLLADEIFTFDEVKYKVGETAFVSLEDALTKLQEGYTLTLRAGIYDQAFAIAVKNVTVKGAVGEKAILSNKVTLTGANGTTLTNLEFTGLGQVYAKGAFDNFVFNHNKVYNSTIEASGYLPKERTDVNAFIQLYTLAGSNVVGNVTITNNIFNGMTTDIISLDRTSAGKVITITDNQFRNYDIGAIRFDGGYNNGTYNILRNVFVNDVLGGSAAIVFRAYSSAAGETQTINIEENLFKNIGDVEFIVSETDTHPASAVITTSTFNDKNVTLTIKNNKFINNVIDLHIRNVGALASTWTGNINNNEFIGTLEYIYYENANLADFNHNYYEDAEGAPITDLGVLATLIKNNTQYSILGAKDVKITAIYEGDTGNLVDGNNALTIGLPEELFNVEAFKNDPFNNVGVNYTGQIRLYTDRNTGNGNTLKISIVEGYEISSVKFTFGAGSNNPIGEVIYGNNVPISLNTEQLTNTVSEYSGFVTEFSLQNTQIGGSINAQIYILSIEITYRAIA